jgi:putative FmdB family regulatory protein
VEITVDILWRMPLYEYRCENGHTVELLQRMGEGPPSACPECGRELRRVYSGRVAVQFSGWGFSKTDSLLPDRRRRGKDFKQLRDKAREIAEG